jgi:general secretion pathway protein I
MRNSPPKRAPSAGFTLIEVMIALLIVSMAFTALMSQIGTQIDATAYLRDRSLAMWVAENQRARVILAMHAGTFPQVGVVAGTELMSGRLWHYSISSETTPVPDLWRHTIRVGVQAQEPQFALTAFISRHPGSFQSMGVQQ